MHDDSIVCVDCGGKTESIKLVDATQPGMALGVVDEKSQASHHIQLQYVAEDSERSRFSKRFPTAGHIRGQMCTDCGRITLYAVPRKQ